MKSVWIFFVILKWDKHWHEAPVLAGELVERSPVSSLPQGNRSARGSHPGHDQ